MKDVVMQQPPAAMTSTTHLGGGVAVVAAAGSSASAANANASSSASAAVSHDNDMLQLADMGTPADVSAEMELLSATNRDMISWLLFNSENMSAPNSLGGAGSGGLDDPFDVVGSSGLSMSLLAPHSSPLLQSSGVLPSTSINTAPMSVDPLQNHHHHNNNNSHQHMQRSVAAALASSNGLATATAAAGSLQVSVQMGNSNANAAAAEKLAAAAKRRGKKRVNDSPVATARSTTTATSASAATVMTPASKKQLTGKENLNGTPMSATQEGLLRHLQSANQALSLSKRGQSTGGGGSSSFLELSSGLSTPKLERASSSGSDDKLTSIQRKQKLERNRESARECRRRKREHILGVEERCRQLERENMELRGQLKAGKEAMKQEEKEKNRVCEELEQMIQRGASEKELAEKIDNFKEQYSDYGHGRRSALSYHLHQIERLLLPTQVTKMCIWALRQDDSFWQDEEDETSLPVILAKELGLTEEQKKKIQQQRCVICFVLILSVKCCDAHLCFIFIFL